MPPIWPTAWQAIPPEEILESWKAFLLVVVVVLVVVREGLNGGGGGGSCFIFVSIGMRQAPTAATPLVSP